VRTLLAFLVPVLLLALAGFLAARQRRRDPRPYWSLRQLDPSHHVVQQALRGEYGSGRTVHQTPDHDAVPQLTPCCDRPVAELPRDEPFTSEQRDVTCGRQRDREAR